MSDSESEQNPLKPLSLPLALRAGLAALLAVSILTRSAPDMMGGFAGASSAGLFAALVLMTLAMLDGVTAFRTGLRLPERSLECRRIDSTYTPEEIRALMVSSSSPNEKFLSLIGRWAARASDRFFHLPPPYQRLVEVALTAIAFMLMAALFAPLLRAFGESGGRPELSEAVLSWLFVGFIFLGYLYWIAMFVDIYSAAKWASTISASRIVRHIGTVLVVAAILAFATTSIGVRLAAAPSMQPWSGIVVWGTVGVLAGILAIGVLRSQDRGDGMKCARIQLSDSAAVHPQSILSALKAVLAQTKGGTYTEIGDWSISLAEQKNMSGGTFSALAVGEYDARLATASASPQLRRFAIAFAWLGIATGAAAYIVLWNAARQPQMSHVFTAAALFLFGSLAMLIANFPLSEKLWRSYLIGVEIQGSYQSRGSVMMSSSGQHGGYGSFLIDYSLDGGVARADSLSFLNASVAKSDARRVLICTAADKAEREAIFSALRSHLARAAGGR